MELKRKEKIDDKKDGIETKRKKIEDKNDLIERK